MIGVEAGSGDRIALAVLAQYRMATTEQMHRVTAPEVRIEQTRRRLARLRAKGLVDRITLPQAGRTRVWFPTLYGVQLAFEWPEMRGHRPSRTVSDPTAVRLNAGQALTVTETALVFLEDARRRGDVCQPLDWIPEVHHPIGSGEAVIPDALLFYRRGPVDAGGSMLRAFVEVDRATMGPEPSPPSSPRTNASTTTCPRCRDAGEPPGTSGGRVAAALPALPPRPVRPGRYRPRGRREPDRRNSRRRRAAGTLPLPVRRPCPRCAAGRPAPPRPSAPVWRPSTTPTSKSPGPAPHIGRHESQPPQRGGGRALTSHGRGRARHGRTRGRGGADASQRPRLHPEPGGGQDGLRTAFLWKRSRACADIPNVGSPPLHDRRHAPLAQRLLWG